MKNAFDDPKMLSMIRREHERSGFSRVAADKLADQRPALSRVAADMLADQKSGLSGVAADMLEDRRSALRMGAADTFSIKSGWTGASISDALAAATSANTSLAQMIHGAQGTVDLNKLMGGVSRDLLREMDLTGSKALAAAAGITLKSHVDWKELASGVSRDWLRDTDVASTKALAAATGMALKSHLVDIADFSNRAQGLVGSLLPERFGLGLSISDGVKSGLTNTFVAFSQSYKNLWRSLELSPASMLSFSPSLSRLPAVEYYNGAILTSRLTGEEETEEDRDTQDGIVLETREVLNDFLSRLNPKLIAMRDGAREALNSTNPDRVRHFSISLRELFTQVLDQLAPDNEIQEWSSSPEHYSKGRPTRKARLLYICRHINQKPLVTFVEKDIDAAVEFMKLFQRGTHAVDALYTPAQLTALEVRMDSTLRFIFEVSQKE